MTTASGVRRPAGLAPPDFGRAARPWLWMSVAAVSIAAVANVVALASVDRVYGDETPSFVQQAIAQDVVGLAVVLPTVLVSAALARRGSPGAALVWLGALSFTVYNYVIYTMSVHVGVLFFAWVAVLGLSLYAMVGGIVCLDLAAVRARFADAHRRVAAWFMIVVGVLFTGLWLSDIIPAMVAGQVPEGARSLALPSSPVHVLDLAFFLPAVFAAGLQLLRGRPSGYAAVPALLVFLALTGAPIMLTPFIAAARGETPAWAVLAPLGAVTLAGLVIAVRLLATPAPDRPREP